MQPARMLDLAPYDAAVREWITEQWQAAPAFYWSTVPSSVRNGGDLMWVFEAGGRIARWFPPSGLFVLGHDYKAAVTVRHPARLVAELSRVFEVRFPQVLKFPEAA